MSVSFLTARLLSCDDGYGPVGVVELGRRVVFCGVPVEVRCLIGGSRARGSRPGVELICRLATGDRERVEEMRGEESGIKKRQVEIGGGVDGGEAGGREHGRTTPRMERRSEDRGARGGAITRGRGEPPPLLPGLAWCLFVVFIALFCVMCWMLMRPFTAAGYRAARSSNPTGSRTGGNRSSVEEGYSAVTSEIDRFPQFDADSEIDLEQHAKTFTDWIQRSQLTNEWSTCSYFRSNVTNLCCLTTAGRYQCVPTVVGIGTQKSGSTVLFARLMLHPHLAAGQRKEVHFFDFSDRWTRGIGGYLEKFALINETEAAATLSMEYSPSYSLPAVGCRRIRQVLPHARLVMLLRDPVHRAWSEIQMKLRHDNSLQEFVLQVVKTSDFKECIDRLQDAAKHESSWRSELISKCISDELKSSVIQHAFRIRLASLVRNKTRLASCRRRASGPEDADQVWVECICRTSNRPSVITLEDTEEDIVRDLAPEARELQVCFDRATADECRGSAKKPSDISRDNLFRGLYAAQLRECYRWFPPAQILLLENEQMRQDPNGTFLRVLAHVGVEPMDLPDQHESSAWEAFRDAFPNFEESTGWAHQGETADKQMPSKVQEFLAEFYEPANRELEELVGRQFAWTKPSSS